VFPSPGGVFRPAFHLQPTPECTEVFSLVASPPLPLREDVTFNYEVSRYVFISLEFFPQACVGMGTPFTKCDLPSFSLLPLPSRQYETTLTRYCCRSVWVSATPSSRTLRRPQRALIPFCIFSPSGYFCFLTPPLFEVKNTFVPKRNPFNELRRFFASQISARGSAENFLSFIRVPCLFIPVIIPEPVFAVFFFPSTAENSVVRNRTQFNLPLFIRAHTSRYGDLVFPFLTPLAYTRSSGPPTGRDFFSYSFQLQFSGAESTTPPISSSFFFSPPSRNLWRSAGPFPCFFLGSPVFFLQHRPGLEVHRTSSLRL